MILEIETLTREDLESKMFLIKDYREFNSKEDKFQVMVVPKSRRNRSLDYETSDDQENSNRLQRQRVNAGQCQSGYRVSNLEGQNWLFLGQTLIHTSTYSKEIIAVFCENLVMPGPQNVLPLYFSKTISYDNNYSNLSNNDFYLKTQDQANIFKIQRHCKLWPICVNSAKGQLISKCLLGIFNSSIK